MTAMIKTSFNYLKYQCYIFLRHLGQSAAACLLAMTRGDISAIGPEHWLVALTTGSVTGAVGVFISMTPLRVHYGNKWFFALVVFVGTFVADWLAHPSHFGGPFTEALVTATAAAVICLALSYSPLFNALSDLERFSAPTDTSSEKSVPQKKSRHLKGHQSHQRRSKRRRAVK